MWRVGGCEKLCEQVRETVGNVATETREPVIEKLQETFDFAPISRREERRGGGTQTDKLDSHFKLRRERGSSG